MDQRNNNIAINSTNLNETPDIQDTFKLPPIKGSKMDKGLTNNYYKRDRIRMARSFLKQEDNIESPNYAPNILDEENN